MPPSQTSTELPSRNPRSDGVEARNRLLQAALQSLLIQMMTALYATARVGRLMLSSQGRSTPSTSRYKNSNALRAWLCVDAETLRSVANIVRKSSTFFAPMSRGCFKPRQRMKKRTHYT